MLQSLFSSGTILFVCPFVALVLSVLLTIFLPKIKIPMLRMLIGFLFFSIGVFTAGVIIYFKELFAGQYTTAVMVTGFLGGALLTFFTEKTKSKVMAIIARGLFFFLAWLFICVYVVLISAEVIVA